MRRRPGRLAPARHDRYTSARRTARSAVAREGNSSPGRAAGFGVPAPTAQPLEPIFFPKLQIYFADFPYIRCRIGQRLLTLDTCCGYEYGRRRNCTFTTIFKAPWLHTQRPRNAGALPTFDPSLLASRFVGPLWFCEVVKKKRELFWEQPRRSRRSLVLPLKLYPPSGAGILTCFPFACGAL